MLDGGAHDTRGALRAQREALVVAILEGVHLLFDDVRHLPDRAPEQLGTLHHGRADLFVSVRFQQVARVALDVLPGADCARQDVVHAADGSDGTHRSGTGTGSAGDSEASGTVAPPGSAPLMPPATSPALSEPILKRATPYLVNGAISNARPSIVT